MSTPLGDGDPEEGGGCPHAPGPGCASGQGCPAGRHAGDRGRLRSQKKTLPWLRIAFGGFIAVLGVFIAVLQWFEAADANDRDLARTYREQAQNCVNGINGVINESLVAMTQVGREMNDLDLPHPVLTPAWTTLDRSISELLFCTYDGGDIIEDPDRLASDAGTARDYIGAFWLGEEAPDGTTFQDIDELFETLGGWYTEVADTHAVEALHAYIYGPDWREHVE